MTLPVIDPYIDYYSHADTVHTPRWLINELKNIVDQLLDNPDIIWLTSIVEQNPYKYNWLQRLIEKYKEIDEVSQLVGNIKFILENRIVEKGLKGELSNAMAIFTLKNHYGYTDSRDININKEKTITYVSNIKDKAKLGKPNKSKIIDNPPSDSNNNETDIAKSNDTNELDK